MIIDWFANIPGAPNFAWWEVCRTNYGEEQNRREFLQDIEEDPSILLNVVAIANHLQAARNQLGFAIPIESWYRSSRVNAAVGSSSPNHRSGGAVDPKLPLSKLIQLHNYFKDWPYGLGFGGGQMHLDLSVGHVHKRRRWKYPVG